MLKKSPTPKKFHYFRLPSLVNASGERKWNENIERGRNETRLILQDKDVSGRKHKTAVNHSSGSYYLPQVPNQSI